MRALRAVYPVLLLLTGLLVLSSCGSREKSLLEENGSEYLYRVDKTILPEGEESVEVNSLFSLNGRICTVAVRNGEEEYGTFLVKYDAAGEETVSVPFSDPDNPDGMLYGVCPGENDEVFALENCYSYDEETGEESSSNYLLRFSSTGELSESYDLKDGEPEEDYTNIGSVVYVGGGKLLGCDGENIFSFDQASGKKQKIHELGQTCYDALLCRLRDGTVLLSAWIDGTGYVLKKVDISDGTLTDLSEIPDNMNSSAIFPGLSHDIYYFCNKGIYCYDLGSSRTDKVCDLLASDILADDLSGIAETEDGRLVIAYSSNGDDGYNSAVKLISRVPPSEAKSKEEITLSCVYANSEVVRRIVSFNENSDRYRIRLVDYASYNTDGDWEYPYKKLNTDIVSGYIPDILVIDNEMPVESFIGKGILEDLTPYLENDEELGHTKLLDNVFEAYRIDGRLYQLIPSFMVYTGITGTDLTGNTNRLTMRDLAAICESRGLDIRNSFGAMTRENLFSLLLYIQGAEYVDLSTGKCAFDSPGFIELLNLVKLFPEKIADDAYMDQQKAYREGNSVVLLYGFSNYKDYANCRYGYFGREIAMPGIPGYERSGSMIMPQIQLAMTSTSAHKEAVWDFIRMFLSEDYQDKLNWGFPVRMDSLRNLGQKSMEKEFYIDEDGEKIEYPNTMWISGQEVEIPPLSEDEVERVTDFLSSCDRRVYINNTVTDIITEESAAFFEGQKSAEEVAKIIQSRVQIYVHENR
ncbi:MAG: extracellular solute-binding protein [Lachnospiraceae bacterium]|nr:extracellular solute-binding protein [Lachnospiraceae bacterium]